jgi:predicted enzyme related to lactoylglutathione lyase
MYVKQFDEQCRFFGPEGFGFPIVREFGTPSGLRGKYHQTGAGFVEIVEDPNNPNTFWDFILSVEDPEAWRQRLLDQGHAPGEMEDMPGERRGFAVQAPSGVGLRIRSLGSGEEPLKYAKDPNGPNVIHFIISWWPGDWALDYAFLSDALDLVTSRGRSAEGKRIAFMRAAYGGRGIVEVLDKQNDPYPGDGLHWRMAVMVDDAAAFHDRLSKAGFGVTDVELSAQGWPAFTASAPAGQDVYVAEIPEGTMPGLLGEPAGLSQD